MNHQFRLPFGGYCNLPSSPRFSGLSSVSIMSTWRGIFAGCYAALSTAALAFCLAIGLTAVHLRYAKENGNGSCSAIINKHLRDLEFRSHMFRHALIDRLKACNDVPTRLAESITGHCSGGSDFNT